MAVTVREVLDDALVATAEPQVEVAGDSLDNPVRWVFTNEREDVASFLAGGELLVVEGRSLVADGREKRADEYVKSLVNADIAALMVELVEEVTQLPKMLVKAAKHEGLTIIGLRRRIPFVDICQSINTMIVRSERQQTVQRTGIQQIPAQTFRQNPGDRAFTGTARAIDGNDWRLVDHD